MGNVVEIARDGALAIVTLNRPEKKNSWTQPMFDALTRASADLAEDASVRAVILRGAGGCFSAGLDFSMFSEFATRLDQIKAEMLTTPKGGGANRFQKPVTGWQDLGIPVIAAIEGVAFGAGLQLALAADFRIAAPDARLSVMEARWGLIPDMGITRSLPRLVRADVAKDLLMTARVVDADEALALGLITRLADDPLAAARALADTLMSRSPEAVQAAKRLVEEAWCNDSRDTLALEARLQADLIGRPNQVEAVMANMQERKPKFQ